MKKLVLFMLAIVVLSLSFKTAARADAGVSVYVNNERVEFASGKPIIENERILAPARDVFSSVGASIAWEKTTKTVIIELDGKTIELAIDKTQVKYTTSEGTKDLVSDVAPKIIDSATYVPLGIIAESLGAQVSWDDATRTASFTFNTDTPDVPAASPDAPKTDDHTSRDLSGLRLTAAYTSSPDKKLSLGDTAEKIEADFGEYDYQNESVYGYAWQELNVGKPNYFMAGINAGKVVAFFSNSKEVSVAGINAGMTASQLEGALGGKLDEESKTVIITNEGTLTIFRNPLEDYSVIAVLTQKAGYSSESKVTNSFFSESTERQLLNIINTERLNRGIKPLAKDDTLAKLAGNHSADMAQNKYLSSVNKKGENTLDRMKNANIDSYVMSSESIGRGYADAIGIFFSWMSDRAHQANIMDSHYNFAGVGTAASLNEHKMYFTINLIER